MCEIIEVGYAGDWISQTYDWLGTILLIVNLVVTVLETFQDLAAYSTLFNVLEEITVAFFAVDYVLRVWSAPYLYEDVSGAKATKKYMTSFTGVIDLLSCLPHYLPLEEGDHVLLYTQERVMDANRIEI